MKLQLALMATTLLIQPVLGDESDPDEGNSNSRHRVFRVNCDRGMTISSVLRYAKPGARILVRGTCREQVRIEKDGIVIRGRDGAAIDGGGGPAVNPPSLEPAATLTVDGAKHVEIMNLTVQNSPGIGIRADNGAGVRLANVTVLDSGMSGITLLNNATAELLDIDVTRSGALGIALFNNSTAVLNGHIAATYNRAGLVADSGSTIEIRGAEVHASQNSENGVDMGINTTVAIFGYDESQASMLIADDNGNAGIFIGTSTLVTLGGPFAGSGTFLIQANNNVGSGIEVPLGGSIVSPFGAARFVVESNDIGIKLGGDSSALIIGGLSVQNNSSTGLDADGAGDLTLVSIPPLPSTIANNGADDVILAFGSRATFGGVAVGSITCDGTALSRGSTICP